MNPGEIVLIPFPFTDLSSIKVRPALIVSNHNLKGEDIIVMGISSKRSTVQTMPLVSSELSKGSLPFTSYLKLGKIVTLDRKMVRKRVALLKQEKLKTILHEFYKLIEIQER